MRNALTDLLSIHYPVLLAPMAWVSGGRLAAAVSRAGGLGFIGAGYGEADWLATQLVLCASERGTKGQRLPFGVGFITWRLQQQPELLQQALAAGPRAVFLSFGAFDEFVAPVRDAGAVLVAQVQTVAQAREAAARGAQVIVAQGGEAGGHGGLRGSMALVPAVVDAVAPLPVVAAGGIADGRGLAAALMLGASAALCGTAFVACNESLAPEAAKRALLEASGDDTVKSPVVDIVRGLDWPAGPWQLRTLSNAFVRRWAGDLPGLRDALPEQREAYARARERGDFDIAATLAGEAADLVRQALPAGQVVEDMVARCHALMASSRLQQ